jgi:Bax protein
MQVASMTRDSASIAPARTPAFPPREATLLRSERLVVFLPEDPGHMVRVLHAAWGEVEGEGAAPNVAPVRLPPGLGSLSVGARKDAVLRGVLPHLLEVNRSIERDRSVLLELAQKASEATGLNESDVSWLVTTAQKYRLKGVDGGKVRAQPAGVIRSLLRRADIVPPSLALAQAAIESGWGGSRFVLEGNNLFGQWVFNRAEGMAPLDRPEGANYAVATYRSLGHSVAAYVRNLNTSWAYKDFRSMRADMRRSRVPLQGDRLAEGLLLYSERREQYVQELKDLMRTNRLGRFDGFALQELGEDWQARLDAES